MLVVVVIFQELFVCYNQTHGQQQQQQQQQQDYYVISKLDQVYESRKFCSLTFWLVVEKRIQQKKTVEIFELFSFWMIFSLVAMGAIIILWSNQKNFFLPEFNDKNDSQQLSPRNQTELNQIKSKKRKWSSYSVFLYSLVYSFTHNQKKLSEKKNLSSNSKNDGN